MNKLAQKTKLDEIIEENPRNYRVRAPVQETLPLYDPRWQERKTNKGNPYSREYIETPEKQIDLDEWSKRREFAPPPRQPIDMNYPPLSPDQIGTRRLNERELKRLQNEKEHEDHEMQRYHDRYDYGGGDYRKKQHEAEIARLEKYKELDNTLPEEIKKQILTKYDEFRKVAAEFYEKYKEANEIASTKNELSYEGTYKDLVRNFAQFTVDMVKAEIGKLFGADRGDRFGRGVAHNASNLADFFKRGLDLFSIHAFNFESKLN
jgi:hypothetical protein